MKLFGILTHGSITKCKLEREKSYVNQDSSFEYKRSVNCENVFVALWIVRTQLILNLGYKACEGSVNSKLR